MRHTRKHNKSKNKYYKKYRKNMSKKHRQYNNHKTKKFRRKIVMRGGDALVPKPNTHAPTTVSFDIGDGKSARGSVDSLSNKNNYGTISYVNSTPQIFLNTLWGAQTNVKNFFNEFFGKSKEYTSSPTDQPIGKTINPYIPHPLTQSDISTFKMNTLAKYS